MLLDLDSLLPFSLSCLGKLPFTFLDLGLHTRKLVCFLRELVLALARLLGDEFDQLVGVTDLLLIESNLKLQRVDLLLVELFAFGWVLKVLCGVLSHQQEVFLLGQN